MNKLKLLSLTCVAIVYFAFIHKGEKDQLIPRIQEEKPIVPYTSEDATLAFEAFNENFYDKEKDLYYSTSAKEGLGSIRQ